VKCLLAATFGIYKRLGHSFGRIDRCLQDQKLSRHNKKLFEGEHKMFAVIDEPERQGNVELLKVRSWRGSSN
jgi:hypothetical protein